MNNKEDNLKEKFRQALVSTAKVISEDYKINFKSKDKSENSKKTDFLNLDKLDSNEDFVRFRAEADTQALKKKFSNNETYQRNLPNNNSCKALYNISEKIRYELLGSKMLKGISVNLRENYNQKIKQKRKDKLENKEDANISEAFELYMLKKFFGIKLNSLSEKILNFWENDFNSSLSDHIDFLNKNLENQENYNSKFSEILQKMDIFNSEDNNEKKEEEENKNEEDNNSQNKAENQSSNDQEQNKEDNTQSGMDAEYDLSDHVMDEQLVDADSEKASTQNISQKKIQTLLIKNIKFILINMMKLQKRKI